MRPLIPIALLLLAPPALGAQRALRPGAPLDDHVRYLVAQAERGFERLVEEEPGDRPVRSGYRIRFRGEDVPSEVARLGPSVVLHRSIFAADADSATIDEVYQALLDAVPGGVPEDWWEAFDERPTWQECEAGRTRGRVVALYLLNTRFDRPRRVDLWILQNGRDCES